MFDKLAKAFDKNPFAFIFGAMLLGVGLALIYLALTAPVQAQPQAARYTTETPTKARPMQLQVQIPATEPEQTIIATDQADADVCDEPKRCVMIAPKAMGVLMRKLEQLENSQKAGAACL